MSERIPKSLKSPGGRRFVVSPHVEHIKPRFEGDTIWRESRAIRFKGKNVGTLHKSATYGPELPWLVTTRQLAWSGGEVPPTGLGFDGGPHATAKEALAEFGTIADEVLDWREGKRVRSIYSKTGYYQRGAK